MLLYLALISGCIGTALIAWQSITKPNAWTYLSLALVLIGAGGTIWVTYDSGRSTNEIINKSQIISKLSLRLYSSTVKVSASQTELRKRADSQAKAQEELRVKSDEIATLNGQIAYAQKELRKKAEEISERNKVIADSVTGGDSCGEVSFYRPNSNNVVTMGFLNATKYALYDVEVLIIDSDMMQQEIKSQPDLTFIEHQLKNPNYFSLVKLGNISPSTLQYVNFSLLSNVDTSNYVVNTKARSGTSSTELKYRKVGNVWKFVGRTHVKGSVKEFGDYDFPKDEKGNLW